MADLRIDRDDIHALAEVARLTRQAQRVQRRPEDERRQGRHGGTQPEEQPDVPDPDVEVAAYDDHGRSRQPAATPVPDLPHVNRLL